MQGRLLLILFGVLFNLFLLGSRVRLNLRLNSLVNVSETDQIQSVIPLSVVESLFRFVSHSLHPFLHLTQILLSQQILVLKRVPVQQVPPESFSIMETISFFKGNVIAGQVVIRNVLYSLGLGQLRVLVSKIKRNIVDKGTHPLADLRHVLVDVSSVDGLQQILQVFNDLQDVKNHLFAVLVLSNHLIEIALELSILGFPGFAHEQLQGM